jgi:hypothetical protein
VVHPTAPGEQFVTAKIPAMCGAAVEVPIPSPCPTLASRTNPLDLSRVATYTVCCDGRAETARSLDQGSAAERKETMHIEPWKRRNRADGCEFVIGKLESYGLRVDVSSRWGKLRQLFFAADGTPRGIVPPDDPDFELVLEGQRDLNQLSFVFDVFPNDFLSGHLDKLRLLLQDPGLPQDAKKTSHGRNTQAELYAAAICWRAGLRPMTLEEPDIRFTHEGAVCGLAVKRLKNNVARIEDRVKDAASQIERSKVPGLIVLDTSLVLNPSNERILMPVPEEAFERSYKKAMNWFLSSLHENLQRWIRGKGVLGIVVMDSQIRVANDGEWEHCELTVSIHTEQLDQRRQREFDSIWSALERGIPNLVQGS